ncbi:MAG: molybdate ABC transporter substrate-binding protein [Armatimonadetes bacterium]|nr:molybdate ABC transporter substrate-binding protein [Armatimonadota bacterium]
MKQTRFGLALAAAAVLLTSFALTGCNREATGETGGVSQGGSPAVTVSNPSAGGSAQSGNSIEIYVPCGMINPFNAMKKDFESAHPDKKLNIVYNNAVVLVRHILKGKRPDILISPGDKELGTVAEKGIIDESTRTAFGTYKLVMIVPKGNKYNVKALQDLTKPEIRGIAMPDPDLNSVGEYTKQSLTKLGSWDNIEKKFLITEFPISALDFVSQKKADVGFSYLTCPLESAPEKNVTSRTVDVIDVIPDDTHKPILVLGAMLNEAKNKEMAKEFLAYLSTQKAQAIMAKEGLPNLPKGVQSARKS